MSRSSPIRRGRVRALLAVTLAVAGAATAGADPAADPADSADPDRALERRSGDVVVEHLPSGRNPSFGPRFAPVTIDLFLDLHNSARHRAGRVAYRNLRVLARRHPRRLRVEIWLIARPGRECVAEAALEAYAQGKFERFISEMYSSSSAPRCVGSHRDLHRKAVSAIAERAGVDTEQIERAWNDGRHLRTIDRNNAYRARRQIEPRPAITVNGELVDRSVDIDIDRLEELYDRAYDQAMELHARGVSVERIYQTRLRELELQRTPEPIKPGATDPETIGGVTDVPRNGALVKALPRNAQALGPSTARVTVAVFCSFRSRDCARMKRLLDELRGDFPDELRLEFHHLIAVEGESRQRARLLHAASLCAGDQGAFWRFYDRLYSDFFRRTSRRKQPVAVVDSVIDRIGLDIARFDTCMDDPGIQRRVEGLVRASVKAGVTHLPSLVVGGRLYIGTLSKRDLRRLIGEELLPGVLEQHFPTWD